jgi:UDP-N-acetylmuramoyl-tripeptide--D-alanyl-D-alanine ligase
VSVEPIAVTATLIAAATGGTVVQGDALRAISGVSIDSRSLAAGDLFVAIRGDRFDGHRFVADALTAGAAGAMVDTVAADLPVATGDPFLVRVPDTIRGLQDLARDVRRQSGTRVVAITGSAGKTTTKEITAEFLASRYRVFRNRGNLNNHIGLPLSLMELRLRPDVAVVELGMNHAGEIRTLVDIAEPDIRVWTNVGDAHLGFFASADAIADAKGEILEQATATTTLVANAADARIMARVGAFAGRVVTFGVGVAADVAATDIETRGLAGTAATLKTPAGAARLETPLLGLGNLANVLAAAAVALEREIPLAEIVRIAATLRPAARRGEVARLPGGVTLIDDSYNASPSALRRALETIAAAAGCARKAAVLGEMLELGDHAVALHRACGEAAAAAGLSWLITVGGVPAQALGEAAIAAGMPAAAVAHAATKAEAAELALRRVRPGDLVLVKGSRGIGTDVVADRLKAEFA